jgi:hypothetical protein
MDAAAAGLPDGRRRAPLKSLAREGTQVLYVRHTTSMLLVVPLARLRGLPCLVRFQDWPETSGAGRGEESFPSPPNGSTRGWQIASCA